LVEDELVHEGAEQLASVYKTDPKADIYKVISEAAHISRDHSKTLTLGSMYGMGRAKMAASLNVPEDEAEAIRARFDAALPFVRELNALVTSIAENRGWIKTLLGRRRHFDLWEPYNPEPDDKPLPEAEAREAYAGLGIRRAHTHKALNSLIQGSAADMTKNAMLAIYQKTGQVPLMAVHDELSYSVPSQRRADELISIMENATALAVPTPVDAHLGDFWSK
jgi:DNA polymerase-1